MLASKSTAAMMMSSHMSLPRIGCLLLLLLCGRYSFCLAALSCETDEECQLKLQRDTTFCLEGQCSNPFVQGCFKTLLKSSSSSNSNNKYDNFITNGRVCNSDDRKAPDGGKDVCMNPYDDEFGYPEIRVHNGNWESSIFLAWIIQILLMEILMVPATVGLTTETTAVSGFYSPINTLEYSSKAYPFESLRDANECHLTQEECAVVLPEVWNGQHNEWTTALNEGYVEPLEGNGQVGKGSWYVPAFTAVDDETLISFYGLRGEKKRQKLANDFKRPTSWGEYCNTVSLNNCTKPDNAVPNGGGYPVDPSQSSRYFAPPDYMGYFHLTDANNCTINPDTCIGHIVGPSCTWSTNIDAQLYWNDIRLRPDGPIQPNGGYDYQSLIEIWRAANETKSNVLFWWWRPEALVEEFHGTQSQFQMVLLPEATDICSRARVSTDDRCSENVMERRGDPEGACDQEAHALQKVFSKAFVESSESASSANKSPGYDLIKALKITDLEINNMLRRWISIDNDRYGNDAREAVCSWVVDNIDVLLDFIPPGYPKQLSAKSSYDTGFLHTATALAAFCTLMVIGTGIVAFVFRKTKVFVYAQSHIVFLILLGFFLITIAAILTTLRPSDPICIIRTWLINLGYTIPLVAQLVKIAAINKILTSGGKFNRVHISRRGMLMNVGFVVCFVIVYLTLWTILDPPSKVEQRVLSNDDTTVIETSLTCTSEKDFWVVIALGWQGLLLLTATVLAFQSRDIVQEFNESRSLGTMIYSHLMFLVLRGIVWNLGNREIFRPNVVAAVTSCLLSLDTLFAICIYLVPKCVEAKVDPNGEKTSTHRGASINHNHTSMAMNELAAQSFQAKMSKVSSNFYEVGDSSVSRASSNNAAAPNFVVPDTTSTTDDSIFSVLHRKRIPSSMLSSAIPEVSCEFDSSDRFRPSNTMDSVSAATTSLDKTNNTMDISEGGSHSGSYRTDPSGAIIRSANPELKAVPNTINNNGDGLSTSYHSNVSGTSKTDVGISGSYMTDASGGIIRTPPQKPSVLRLSGNLSSGEIRSKGIPSSSTSSGLHFSNNTGSLVEETNEGSGRSTIPTTTTTTFVKPSTFRLRHLEEQQQQSIEESSDDDEYDNGGPRFAHPKHNEDLQMTIRSQSSVGLSGSDSDSTTNNEGQQNLIADDGLDGQSPSSQHIPAKIIPAANSSDNQSKGSSDDGVDTSPRSTKEEDPARDELIAEKVHRGDSTPPTVKSCDDCDVV